MLFAHALVPSAFRLQVSAMIQESPSKFFLTASGLLKPRHAAHRSKTPTAGVLMRPLDRKPGRSSRNGSGISVWSWVICLNRRRCAPPSLLPLCPRPKSSSLPPRAMASPRLPHPGKLAASLGRTLPSSLTGRCAAQPISHLWHTSGAGKLMEACAWSMRPVSAVVVPVLCATSVNGMAALPLSLAR